jgi:serine/threonine protein kinase
VDAQRWERVRALFEQLADHAPTTWTERLLALAPDDAGLHDEVLSMLRADLLAQQRASRAAGDAPALIEDLAERESARVTDAWIGRELGAWRIERALGQGGMGVVYLAERRDGQYRQQAALKMLRGSASDAGAQARFVAERQMLAGLEHPRIARLLDGGSTPQSGPWFALEYVDGTTLLAWCDAHRLGVNERLQIFLEVCAAVSHAHERLIVHRDLKPANILVDRDGQVKLLDFGIAKLLDVDGAQTGTAMRAFTPEYAAPEQIRGERVSTAVDVYALGVILCELLSGRRPYRPRNAGAVAYERAVLEQDASAPSGIVTLASEGLGASDEVDGDTTARCRRMSASALRARLRGDLDAIVLKALRKEPGQRYASVREFADDVRAVLEHRPVQARRGTWRYRAGRFLRRHRVAVAFGTLAALALVAGSAASLWQAREARLQRDLARSEAGKAREALTFMGDLFRNADPGMRARADLSVQDLLDEGVIRMRDSLTRQDDVRAELLLTMAGAYAGLNVYAQADPLLDEAAAIFQRRGDRVGEARVLVERCSRWSFSGEHDRCEMDRALALLDLADPTQAMVATRAMDLVAIGHSRNDRHPQAIAVIRRALTILPAGPDTLRRRSELTNTLSYSLVQAGERDAAEAHARAVLQEIEALSPPPPRLLADALGTLSYTLPPARRDEALQIQARSVAAMESLYGAESPVNATMLNNYATALFAAGRLDDADAAMARVLAMRRATPNVDPQSMANTLGNLAAIRMQRGDTAQAMPLLHEAVALFGEGSPRELANALRWRALAHFFAGDGDAAARDIATAMQTLTPVFAADDQRVRRTALLGQAFELARGAGPACAAIGDLAPGLIATPDLRDEDRQYFEFLAGACRDGDRASPAAVDAALQTLASQLPTSDYRYRIAARIAAAR